MYFASLDSLSDFGWNFNKMMSKHILSELHRTIFIWIFSQGIFFLCHSQNVHSNSDSINMYVTMNAFMSLSFHCDDGYDVWLSQYWYVSFFIALDVNVRARSCVSIYVWWCVPVSACVCSVYVLWVNVNVSVRSYEWVSSCVYATLCMRHCVCVYCVWSGINMADMCSFIHHTNCTQSKFDSTKVN